MNYEATIFHHVLREAEKANHIYLASFLHIFVYLFNSHFYYLQAKEYNRYIADELFWNNMNKMNYHGKILGKVNVPFMLSS